MVEKEHTCLFHWIQSFNRHTKHMIKPRLEDQHKVLYFDYKNSKSLDKVDVSYATIHCCWLLSGAKFEFAIHKLGN